MAGRPRKNFAWWFSLGLPLWTLYIRGGWSPWETTSDIVPTPTATTLPAAASHYTKTMEKTKEVKLYMFGKEAVRNENGTVQVTRFPFRGVVEPNSKGGFFWRLVLWPWHLQAAGGKAETEKEACAKIEAESVAHSRDLAYFAQPFIPVPLRDVLPLSYQADNKMLNELGKAEVKRMETLNAELKEKVLSGDRSILDNPTPDDAEGF